jgi:pimeloyl-ACP methyl ester carboxylesterase
MAMRLFFLLMFVLVLVTTSKSQSSKEDRSPHTTGFVTVNGIKLHYLDWGGTGEAVLFLTGTGDNAHVFDEMAPKFTDRFRVLALTRRGFGQSDKPDTGYDIATLTEDVRQFLDTMKIERVNLVGHSAAGTELTLFAGLYPSRTLRLVYLDAAYDRTEVPEIEAKDPLPISGPESKQQEAHFIAIDQFKPDYSKVKARCLSFYAIFETHWGLKPGSDDATRRKAEEYMEKEVRPWQWKNIERFRKEVINGRVVVIRNSHHYFFRDPSMKDEIVSTIRSFLIE